MTSRLLVLELNEVNFEAISSYIEQGHLPHFSAFLERHGLAETTSEKEYENLEPWIQWVTAHTGLTLREHGIFRLGDIVNSEIVQIWERLADYGVSVGAISPMNAKCRGSKWDFFLPDPWTKTNMVAPPLTQQMFSAIAQIINDNAQKKVSLHHLRDLLIGGAFTALPGNYLSYVKYLLQIPSRPWTKAIFLDQMLADLFTRLIQKNGTQFATLFLNSAAHIQHHYMFSSSAYPDTMRNPEWYVKLGQDPLLDVYMAYDRILGDLRARFPDARIMLATGLHQEPHPALTYYWRLKDHAAFLKKIGVSFQRVEPRMSRDFVIFCETTAEATRAAAILESAVADDECPLFEVDNRGKDLFVMLTYPNDIHAVQRYRVGNVLHNGIKNDVAFVAIKNGQHNGVGYFSDSGLDRHELETSFPLASLPNRILAAFELESYKIADALKDVA